MLWVGKGIDAYIINFFYCSTYANEIDAEEAGLHVVLINI